MVSWKFIPFTCNLDMVGVSGGTVAPSFLDLETGFKILLETGDGILLE
jgi:hypothetical protein